MRRSGILIEDDGPRQTDGDEGDLRALHVTERTQTRCPLPASPEAWSAVEPYLKVGIALIAGLLLTLALASGRVWSPQFFASLADRQAVLADRRRVRHGHAWGDDLADRPLASIPADAAGD